MASKLLYLLMIRKHLINNCRRWTYHYYLFLLLTKCKHLLRKIYSKIAIPICGMLIKVNKLQTY